MPFTWDDQVGGEPSEAATTTAPAAAPAPAPASSPLAAPAPVLAPTFPVASAPAHLPGCSGRGATEARPAGGSTTLPVTNAMMKAYVAMRGGLHGVPADAPEPLLGRMLDQELVKGVGGPL